MNRFKSLITFVNHLDESNSSFQAEVSLTGSIEPVFFIALDLSSPCEGLRIRSYEVVFELWSDGTVDGSNEGMVSAVGSEDKLMVFPELPHNFSTDDIVSFI